MLAATAAPARSMSFSPLCMLLLLALVAVAGAPAPAAERPRLVVGLGHARWVQAVAFAGDGRRVLTGGDRVAVLWDAGSGREVRRFTGHAGLVAAVAFSADGRRVLTGSYDRTAALWDAGTGRRLQVFTDSKDEITGVALTRDGKRFLTGTLNGTVQMWNVDKRKPVKTFEGRAPDFRAVAMGPLGGRVVIGKTQHPAGPKGKKATTLAHPGRVTAVAVSPDGKRVLLGGAGGTLALYSSAGGKKERDLAGGHDDRVQSAAFAPGGKRLATGSADRTTRLWDVDSGKELCRLVSFRDGTWAVVDTEGRYDASNGGDVAGLHWVVGDEPIALAQLKEHYYEPGLLPRLLELGVNPEPLRPIDKAGFVAQPKLHPDIKVEQPDAKKPVFVVRLSDRGGGIGAVTVRLNGKEVVLDARQPDGRVKKLSSTARELTLRVDLSGDARLTASQANRVEVVAANARGDLASRGMVRSFAASAAPAATRSRLHALVVGVSKYRAARLDLRYSSKDAHDFAAALELAARGLFAERDRVKLTLLSSDQKDEKRRPSRANLLRELKALEQAKPEDVVVLYLAGHGVNHGGADGDYYYLTADAAGDKLADKAVRETGALSSRELTAWLARSPALRQVLILDTCASGELINKLSERRSVPASQVRAMERVKDRTGMHVLAGCTANAVSYEANRFAQGLLTYSLLAGMRGAALATGGQVDVLLLFRHATEQVPVLARDVGGVQRPVYANPIGGQSFAIGRLSEKDRGRVPLEIERPLVLRCNLQDQARRRDHLALAREVNEQLHAASTRRRARLGFVDAAEFPGAHELVGRYVVKGQRVSVDLTLFLGEKTVARFEIAGERGKLDELARRVVAEVEKRLGSR
jgi:WD40 repeat protein